MQILINIYFLLSGRANSGYSSRSRGGGRGGMSRGRGAIGRGDPRNDREGSETSDRGGSYRYVLIIAIFGKISNLPLIKRQFYILIILLRYQRKLLS